MSGETLILLIVGAIILYAIYNNMSSPSETYEAQSDRDSDRQGERPKFDDRNVQGRGSFGRPQNPTATAKQRPSTASSGKSRRENRRREPRQSDDNDNNVRGRGSFGRSK